MMNSRNKKTIGVARGGPSAEYEFSLDTGSHALMALEGEYNTRDILIDKEEKWIVSGKYTTQESALWDLDSVFNALHGAYGEDGGLQDILEAHSIPYTGSDSFSSCSSLHKGIAKKFFNAHGLKTPHSKIFTSEEETAEEIALGVFGSFPLPMIVKPVHGGGSFGVRPVTSFGELESAIRHALQYDKSIMVEEYIKGVVVTCGVVENFRDNELYTLMPVQIKMPPNTIFLAYEKTIPVEYIVPAPIKREDKMRIEELARLAHRILGLRHYSSSDFIISPNRGIFLLETNSLPHLGTRSPFISSIEAVGSSRTEFIRHILSLVMTE